MGMAVPTYWTAEMVRQLSDDGKRYEVDYGEVLSRATARADRFAKRRRYQEAGVPHYWVVDGDGQRVEVWTPAAELPVTETARLTWRPRGAAEAFTLELAELFRPV